ncbi:MAG: alcohol dehydrogenase catalytic domain-containing protein [Phycisphaerae bacterium]
MKAAVLTGLKKIEIADIPPPIIQNDTDVLLKIEMAGVCGSDIHYYETGRIGSQVIKYPFVVGHECAATVMRTGKNVIRVKTGDRVAVEAAVCCHQCDQCKSGRENTCRNLKFLGCPGQLSGCFCEYIVMPEDCCFAIDNDMSFEKAVMCEPLAIGLYAVQRANLTTNSSIAVLGAGPIGLSCVLAAKNNGINRFYITEKIEERIKLAQNTSPAWIGNPLEQNVVQEIIKFEPNGVDFVFECAGQQETIDQAVEILKPGGKLMLIGIPRQACITLSADLIRRKEITLINVRRQNNFTKKCVDLVQSGQIKPDFMVTHRFKLEDIKEVFEIVSGYCDGVLKALIEI